MKGDIYAKKVPALLLYFCMLTLVGCTQESSAASAAAQVSSVQQQQRSSAGSLPASQKSGAQSLVFDTGTADPQSMAPVFEKGTCRVLAVFTQESGEYKGTVEIARKFPQGYDEASGKKQPEGYMLLTYKSTFSGGTAEDAVPAEAKTALDKLAGGDKGQRFYGVLPTAVRQEQRTVTGTFDFRIPYDFSKKQANMQEIPYLLSVNGNNAKLYLYFHKLAVVAVEGERKDFSTGISSGIPAKTDAACVYINDTAIHSKTGNLQERWRLLFLGKNSGDSFSGGLYLCRVEEKTGAYPGNVTLTGNCRKQEASVELRFQPFDEAAYRKAGGRMGSIQTARLSHMAEVKCQGQSVLFTAADDTIFAELPGSGFQGALEGRLTGNDGQIARVYQESMTLCHAEYMYSVTPHSKGEDDLEAAAQQGAQAEGIKLTEEQLNMIRGSSGFMSRLDGQCLWLPPNFMPLTKPMDCLEQNVSTAPVFSYTEDGLWLDTIGPIYTKCFSKMRGFSVREGDSGGHNTMEMVFRYGDKTIYIEISDGPAGANVTVFVFGQ
jgi:hypothetical protein